MLPYGRQWIDQEDLNAVARVLTGDFLTQGPTVEAFESAFAAYVGASEAIAVSNGTAALHLACLAYDFGPGDAVIVPAITFAASANAVLYCGATPVFADVDPANVTLAPEAIEKACRLSVAEGLRPRGVVPVHYAGLPCDMERIEEAASSNGLKIIEDACHSLGAEYRGRVSEVGGKVGSREGGVAAFSFHPVKHIATGEGGCLTTQDRDLASKLRRLRTHGITREAAAFEHLDMAKDGQSGKMNPWYHEMQDLGFNYRLCDIQAALGVSQLRRVQGFVDRRREIAAVYRRELAGISGLRVGPGDAEAGRHSYHLFPICIAFAKIGKSRRQVMEELRAEGVGTQVHYIPVYRHPYYQRNKAKWRDAGCEAAEAYYAETLSIPMFPAMSDGDIAIVVAALRKVVR